LGVTSLWLQQRLEGKPCNRFNIAGPRGGGKSMLLECLGFDRWFLKCRNRVTFGGSLEQAKGVYRSHLRGREELNGLPAEPTMLKTESDRGNYFKAVAASQKQVRGPHVLP
jgi:hypothetical protein